MVFRYRSGRSSARRGLSRERQLLKEDQKKNQSKAQIDFIRDALPGKDLKTVEQLPTITMEDFIASIK